VDTGESHAHILGVIGNVSRDTGVGAGVERGRWRKIRVNVSAIAGGCYLGSPQATSAAIAVVASPVLRISRRVDWRKVMGRFDASRVSKGAPSERFGPKVFTAHVAIGMLLLFCHFLG
jgi:hypothetical protein